MAFWKTPAALLAAALSLASCSGSRDYRAVVALDEAFVAAYPSLAAALEKPAAFEGAFGAALGGSPKRLRISLTQGAGLALDAAREAATGSSRPVALVTSPLIASALLGGGVWKGNPPLLVPEWRGKPSSGLWTATTDPVPAYRQAGSALGAYIAELGRKGGSPSCGILFTEGPSRPRSALNAFAEAYSEASGGADLLVREIPASTGDTPPAAGPGEPPAAPSGSRPDAAPAAPAPQAAVPAAASAKALGPEEAVKEMLGSDIRALFVALGPDTVVAVKAAARPGLALGADYPDPVPLKALSFRITPNEAGLVEALARELRPLGKGGAGTESRAAAVPARLEIGGAASALKAGDRSLAAFLRRAGSGEAR